MPLKPNDFGLTAGARAIARTAYNHRLQKLLGPAARALGTFGLAVALMSCGTAPEAVSRGSVVADDTGLRLPIWGNVANPPLRSNAAMANDFLDLMFTLESGRPLPVMSRFEGEIRVAMLGAIPASASADLDALLVRLQGEAGLNIRRAASGEAAELTVELVPTLKLRLAESQAACFVATGVSSWDDYTATKGGRDWARLRTRQKLAVFIPADATPQDLRDCLHEEFAQALGPVNDLYRLTDSVFNDDNFHSVLTRFDMLMLRVAYDPALKSGMTRAEVAAKLPAILARLNPGGGGVGKLSATPYQRQQWELYMDVALSAAARASERRAASEAALALAGDDPDRLALSHFALGRALTGFDNDAARANLAQAMALWRMRPGNDIRIAHAILPFAIYALAFGQTDEALNLIDQAIPAAYVEQNAALLAQFLLIRAQAIEEKGDHVTSEMVRADAEAYGAYGFGSLRAFRQRARGLDDLANAGNGR